MNECICELDETGFYPVKWCAVHGIGRDMAVAKERETCARLADDHPDVAEAIREQS